MTDDRFEEFLREEAESYRTPPPTPREEIWARIEAARRVEPTRAAETTDLTERRLRRRLRWQPVLAAAAVLALAVAIGRVTVPRPGQAGPVAAAPAATLTADPAAAPGSVATALAAANHLTRIEALLTDYQTGRPEAEVQALARELLSRTRLWLDGDRLDDPRLRALLEDLEVVLVQLVQLAPNGQAGERALIDEGLAERQIRPRLRGALPPGPAA